MYDNETIIRAKMRDYSFSADDEIELFMVRKLNGKAVEYGQPIVMAKAVAGVKAPVIAHIDKRQGQQLMDDLWQCGLRPSEGTGSAGALAAVQAHLADFKKIAFKQLKI